MAALLLCVASNSAYAQSSKVSSVTSADEQIVNTLNPVVITGTGTYHKSANSPIAVKVITAKEIKEAHLSTLQEALSKLASNITIHTNGMGSFVNFNGVSDDYIVILENGKRVSGDDRWNRISMDNVKRIEIQNGAASALYGSDAIAGVINIITDETNNAVDASMSSRLASKGRLEEDVNVDVNAGKFSSFTSFSHKQADNWQVNRYQEFEEGETSVYKLTGRPMSVGYKSNNASERLEWKFNDKWSIYARGNYYYYHTERPQSAMYFTQKVTTNNDTGDKTYTYTEKQAYTYDLHHQSFNYGAGTRWQPNSRTHVYLDLYSDNFSSAYDYWQTAQKEGYEESRKRTHYYNETLKGIFRLADWNKLSVGLEMEQHHLSSVSDNIDGEHTNTYNIFAQDEVKICKGLEGVFGLRYTYNDHFGSNITPNVALFYHIKGFRLRASYAEGYRAPSLSQLYATDQAKTSNRYTIYNTALKPERNNFWNANAEYANDWFSLSMSGFINKIRNMINYRTMTKDEIDADAYLTDLYNEGWTTIRQRDNIDRATIKGISLNAKFILPLGFVLGGGYTFTDSKAKTKTLDKKTQQYVVTQTPVDKSVKHVANINAAWDKTWHNYHLCITLNGHIQGERYSSTYGFAPKYQQWDLNTCHTVSMKQFVLEPGLGVENIFNKRDTSYWNSNFSTTHPGRSVYVSLALRYKK